MFGNNLKTLRIEKGISQEELGKILGVRKNSISNWENSKSAPTFETLLKISEYFGVTTDLLLGLKQVDLYRAEQLKKLLYDMKLMSRSDDLTNEELALAIKNMSEIKKCIKKDE